MVILSLLSVGIKYLWVGDTSLLGRLAKAGHFCLLENIPDALGINCVLSENCSLYYC